MQIKLEKLKANMRNVRNFLLVLGVRKHL